MRMLGALELWFMVGNGVGSPRGPYLHPAVHLRPAIDGEEVRQDLGQHCFEAVLVTP